MKKLVSLLKMIGRAIAAAVAFSAGRNSRDLEVAKAESEAAKDGKALKDIQAKKKRDNIIDTSPAIAERVRKRNPRRKPDRK